MSQLNERNLYFEVDRAVDECALLLERKSERKSGYFAARSTLAVKVAQVDQDSYAFNVERDAGRGLFVEAHGKLEKRDEYSTIVKVKSALSGSTFYFLLCIFIISGIITFFAHLYFFTVLGAIATTVLWWTALHGRDQLLEAIRDTLSG